MVQEGLEQQGVKSPKPSQSLPLPDKPNISLEKIPFEEKITFGTPPKSRFEQDKQEELLSLLDRPMWDELLAKLKLSAGDIDRIHMHGNSAGFPHEVTIMSKTGVPKTVLFVNNSVVTEFANHSADTDITMVEDAFNKLKDTNLIAEPYTKPVLKESTEGKTYLTYFEEKINNEVTNIRDISPKEYAQALADLFGKLWRATVKTYNGEDQAYFVHGDEIWLRKERKLAFKLEAIKRVEAVTIKEYLDTILSHYQTNDGLQWSADGALEFLKSFLPYLGNEQDVLKLLSKHASIQFADEHSLFALALKMQQSKELQNLLEENGLEKFKDFLRKHDVSEESLNALRFNYLDCSTAAYPIAKLSYELNLKVLKPMLGVNDESYARSLLNCAMKCAAGKNIDLQNAFTSLVKNGEKLHANGVPRDILMKAMKDESIGFQIIEASDEDRLHAAKDSLLKDSYLNAKVIPQLQDEIAKLSHERVDSPNIQIFYDPASLESSYFGFIEDLYSIADVRASMPIFLSKNAIIEKASGGKIRVELKINEEITNNRLFRADGGSAGGLSSFEAPETEDFHEIFDIAVSQKGIGHKSTNKPHSGTFVSEDPVYAEGYVTVGSSLFTSILQHKVGFWVIKKDALLDVPLKLENDSLPAHSEVEFTDVIPLKYVEFLIVPPQTRANILAKYGGDNTEIFGTALKDVVIPLEEEVDWKQLNFTPALIKTLGKK